MNNIEELMKLNHIEKVVDSHSGQEVLLNLNTPGWNYKETLICYSLLAKKLKENSVVVEVGAGLGISIWAIALNAPSSTHIYAIDEWLNKDVNPNKSPFYKNYVPGLENSQANFLKYTKHLTNVTPIKAHSLKNSVAFDQIPKADLVILDVDHVYDEWYDNILFWSGRLNENGIIAGNDYILNDDGRSEYITIKSAIDDAAKFLNKSLEVTSEAMFWAMNS